MSVDIYNTDFQNWLKCVFGLSTTRAALIECISDKLDAALEHIFEQTSTSSLNLKQYFVCLETNRIYRFKAKAKYVKRWNCSHSECEALMTYFIHHHFDGSSLNFKWDKEASSSTASVDIGNQDSDSKLKIVTLYVYIKRKASVEHYTSLNCLDISHILKFLASCKLFSPDNPTKPSEKIFQVLLSRNEIMHSPDSMISKEDTRSMLNYMMDLLGYLAIAEKTYFKNAVQELKNFLEHDFVVSYQSEHCYQIMTKVEKAKIMADDLNTSIEDNKQQCKIRSRRLLDVLESITVRRTTRPLERQNVSYKICAKEALEKKKDALKLDKAQRNENGKTYKMLEALIKKTEQDIKKVEELRQKLEPDKMAEEISYLKKEKDTLKAEMEKQQGATQMLESDGVEERTSDNDFDPESGSADADDEFADY